MNSYSIESDLETQKYRNLTLVLIASLIFTWATINLAVLINLPGMRWSFVLVATLIVSNILKKRQQIRLASTAYLFGTVFAAAAYIIEHGVHHNEYFLFLIPVALSGLLLDTSNYWVTALAIVCMFGATLPHSSVLETLENTVVPICAAICVSIVAYITARNNFGLVEWAIDSEQKIAQRAEMYYAQGQELEQAFVDLRHAHANLELLNTRLAEAQGRAERASNAKSVFMSNMSHELRTPLNVIIGYTSSMLSMPQMYSSIPLPPVYSSDIQLIKENGEYLVGLINDILDLSKIEAGKLELHTKPVSLTDLLRGTIATSIGLIKDKPLQIIPDFADDLPMVMADPMRVRQIILNLMSNAIKFTETGSVTLSAYTDEEWLRISVTDTGIGIPAEVLPMIFDRFKQAEQDTDKRYGGTGLGLDISLQLSKMHGGQLTVTSKVGQGSTFSFTLPLANESEIELEAASPEIAENIRIFDETDIETTHTILLVEDEMNTRTMLRRILENEGYVVVDTNNGAQVFELASGLLPSLIVLDIYLPEKNGWRILEELKDDIETASIPVIICTANTDTNRSAELGAAAHLLKPIQAADLINTVNQVLFVPSLNEGISS